STTASASTRLLVTRLWRAVTTMLRRILFLFIVLAALAFFIEAQQGSRSSRKTSQAHKRSSKRKPAKPPVKTFASDSGGRELIVRLLNVGQGDATYIRNGARKVIVDGGPNSAVFGRYLD